MGGTLTKAGAVSTAGLSMVLIVGLVVGSPRAAGNTTPLSGTVDLSIEVVAQPNPAPAGSTVVFESLVRNRGTLMAEGVTGIFEIPATGIDTEFGSHSCTAVGSARLELEETSQPWTVSCNLGTLPPGSEAHIVLTVTTGPPGTVLTEATVSSGQVDARPTDNRVEIPLFVLPDGPGFARAFQQPGLQNDLGRSTA